MDFLCCQLRVECKSIVTSKIQTCTFGTTFTRALSELYRLVGPRMKNFQGYDLKACLNVPQERNDLATEHINPPPWFSLIMMDTCYETLLPIYMEPNINSNKYAKLTLSCGTSSHPLTKRKQYHQLNGLVINCRNWRCILEMDRSVVFFVGGWRMIWFIYCGIVIMLSQTQCGTTFFVGIGIQIAHHKAFNDMMEFFLHLLS